MENRALFKSRYMGKKREMSCGEKMSTMDQELFWLVICTVVNKLWHTRSFMVIHQEIISGAVVSKQIKTELTRQRTLD